MKIIGMVGSRRRDSVIDFKLACTQFKKIYEDGDRIVSGGCREGGDRFAEIIARKYGIPILIHFAQWDKYGKKAGFIRNTAIVKDCDVLIALVSNPSIGGTKDTLRKAKKLGKKIILL